MPLSSCMLFPVCSLPCIILHCGLRDASNAGMSTSRLAGKRVRIEGTSKEEINGQMGRATGFDSEKMRYIVTLDNGAQNSFAVKNVVEVSEAEDPRRPTGEPAYDPFRECFLAAAELYVKPEWSDKLTEAQKLDLDGLYRRVRCNSLTIVPVPSPLSASLSSSHLSSLHGRIFTDHQGSLHLGPARRSIDENMGRLEIGLAPLEGSGEAELRCESIGR